MFEYLVYWLIIGITAIIETSYGNFSYIYRYLIFISLFVSLLLSLCTVSLRKLYLYLLYGILQWFNSTCVIPSLNEDGYYKFDLFSNILLLIATLTCPTATQIIFQGVQTVNILIVKALDHTGYNDYYAKSPQTDYVH